MNTFIRLLGSPSVETAGQTLEKLRTRKTWALLAYLIQHEQPVARVRLVDLFWGETTEARGRRSLTTEISYLSKLFPEALVADRQAIQFKPPADYWIDTKVFQYLVQVGEQAEIQPQQAVGDAAWLSAENIRQADKLTEAVSLYRDPFMAGLQIDRCPDYDAWLAIEQERWQQQTTALLAQLTHHYQHLEQPKRAIIYVRRWLKLEPWREEAHQQMMTLLAQLG